MKISQAEAKEIIHSTRAKGTVFGVEFIKRTTGEIRRMNCRLDVKKYTVGGELPYHPADYALIPVWDVNLGKNGGGSEGYRMINAEGIIKLTVAGIQYEVETALPLP
tara:strand:+ start:323 stop:643 length:321 start_codon:yes stop_codon:yes gene_type:complete